MNTEEIVNLLKEEVVPAIGCTEPVAIALASAYAHHSLEGKIKRIKLSLSSNVYKNAKAVGIPGTHHTGIETALALGICIQEPAFDLTILSPLTDEDIEMAMNLQREVPIEVEILYDSPSVYIEVGITTDREDSKAIIAERHTNLVFLERSSQVIIDRKSNTKRNMKNSKSLAKYPLKELIGKILEAPYSSLEFLLEGISLNMTMAEAGLKMEKGMNLGKSWEKIVEKGFWGKDLNSKITLYTSAACDARMAGVRLPVMSSSGSGNNGIISIIPISIVAEHLKSGKEKVVQALAISHMVNTYIKEYIGRLSPICGCGVSAGAGAGAGIVHLLEGGMEDIERAIINVISGLAGMICDGGKVGCALKLSASAGMAWQGALLAKEGVKVPEGNGIVASSLQKTLENLGKISQEGMFNVDKSVISAMYN
ncbi:L-serine ammonia-lyase, iron-sulfur-dependent, subunit alpha [Irregularibacter muris]|uniref:UPF0597 protein NSA47_12205 n=1 Tax=Irregularibacter muris TaxID=1796619 RepID=A0AAE3HFN8_9FIRM|nr:L-serine ammonia-lyase, iron-sulfur-dependent, subunit alpha [Irregularibacter muris]MCR1899740.1 L-serine ammonia-lyase, iron-sulfur-dependent, subunit alpha [Irregularibacter muris]